MTRAIIELSEIISEEYGHDFMMAAVRGRFILSGIPDKEGHQPPDAEEEPEEPEQESADDLSVDGQAEVQQEEIPDEPSTVKNTKRT